VLRKKEEKPSRDRGRAPRPYEVSPPRARDHKGPTGFPRRGETSRAHPERGATEDNLLANAAGRDGNSETPYKGAGGKAPWAPPKVYSRQNWAAAHGEPWDFAVPMTAQWTPSSGSGPSNNAGTMGRGNHFGKREPGDHIQCWEKGKGH